MQRACMGHLKDGLETGVEDACSHAVLEALMEVADGPEFLFQPTAFDALLELDSVAADESSLISAAKAVSAASIPLLIAR